MCNFVQINGKAVNKNIVAYASPIESGVKVVYLNNSIMPSCEEIKCDRTVANDFLNELCDNLEIPSTHWEAT